MSTDQGKRPSGKNPSARQGPGAAAGGQAPLGYDPGRDQDKEEEKAFEFRKRYANIDLPPEAYGEVKLSTPFTRRPGYNQSGQPIVVEVNQFAMKSMEGVRVYQYDIVVNPEPTRPAFYKRLWLSNAVQDRLQSLGKHTWIHDGRRLAWSRLERKEQIDVVVDMDKEKGQASRPDHNNTFKVVIRPSTSMDMGLIQAYLSGSTVWDNSMLECMNFLDHLIRMGPTSRGLLKIKRNFYDPEAKPKPFDDMVVAKKGIYAAITMNGVFSDKLMMGLALNVDVANTTFWNSCKLTDMMDYVVRAKEAGKWRNAPKHVMFEAFTPQRAMNPDGTPQLGNLQNDYVWEPSSSFRHLRILHKVEFEISHIDKKNSKLLPKTYKIQRFEFDQKYGQDGANADTIRFIHEGLETTVKQYFAKKYRIFLDHPKYPCVVTSRQGVFPPEVCKILPNQRYNFKLTPDQTSEMIRFAVTRPAARKGDIMSNVGLLDWPNDRFLKDFGVAINPQMTRTKARLLPAPKIVFANGDINPGVSGRWDLRGKRFVFPNSVKISSWALVSYSRKIDDKKILDKFASTFKTVFRNHGGDIDDKVFIKTYNPQSVPLVKFPDQLVHDLRNSPFKDPRIVLVVLPDRSAERYETWKKGFDCKFALLTQFMQDVHVLKGNAQYVSNVSMKVNAKMGGATSKAVIPNQPRMLVVPTIIFGVDISHPSPGVLYGSSIAAVTMSVDQDATRYIARCETNGNKMEVLAPNIIRDHIFNLIGLWYMRHNKTDPQHIFYLRDGVAHSQFSQVLENEIDVLKMLLAKRYPPEKMPKFTVLVAQKRHHIRFFPNPTDKVSADRNGNAHPGTLVERDVTHPFHYDFFLSSHSAIQGTARPTHYHVLLDEANMTPEALHRILYAQCYQYVRSTTPVSVHPAIYYAHLACRRGVTQEDVHFQQKHKSDERKQWEAQWAAMKKDPKIFVREAMSSPPSKMLPIGMDSEVRPNAKDFFRHTMWFV